MLRWSKRVSLALTLLVVGWLAVMWTGWLPRPTAPQRAALAVLAAPAAVVAGSDNAYPLLWLLRYDIPEAELDAVMAADLAAFATHGAAGTEAGAFTSTAEGRYPRLPSGEPAQPRFCNRDAGCLAQVRADPAPMRAALTRRAGLLARLRRLPDFDHVRVLFPPSLHSPLPALGEAGGVQLSEAALRYVDGQRDQAMAGLCRDVAGWRQLRRRNDSLLVDMVAASWISGGVRLYADMRAELPAGLPVPAACRAAFAPLAPSERSQCASLRSEFVMLATTIDDLAAGRGDAGAVAGTAAATAWGARLLINAPATRAQMAPAYADSCALAELPLAEWPPVRDAGVDNCRISERVFNPVGCILAEVAAPDFRAYQRRLRDLEGQLRLLALGEWLSVQPDPAQAFVTRPAAHRRFEAPVAFEADRLRLDLLQPNGADAPAWDLPLPGSRPGRDTALEAR